MCRNIRPLFNFDPPATDAEIRASALQYVRKVSGFTRPSQANEAEFERAVDDVAAVTRRLVDHLVTKASPKDREIEAAKARERASARYGSAASGLVLAFFLGLSAASAAARQPSEEGKLENVVVWSGDPFDFSGYAERVFIAGREMEVDSRQRRLFERYRMLP